MKFVTKLSLVITAALALSYGAQASAASTCYVSVTHLCFPVATNSYYAPGHYFIDTDPIANINAARCLERAQDFKSWCRNPKLEAVSVFNVDGRNSIAGHTNADGKVYISNGVGRTTGFHN